MNFFIHKLAEEFLFEGKSQIPRIFSEFLLSIVRKDPYVSRMMTPPNTTYLEQPGDSDFNTAGVMPVGTNRLIFIFVKKFIDEAINTEAKVNFLLKHELLHIVYGDYERGRAIGALTKEDHRTYNFAADVVINEKIIKEGGFGGLPAEMPLKGWTLESVKQSYGEEYTGPMQAEVLYKWMKDRMDKLEEEEEEDEMDQYEIGMPVFNENTGEFGKIVSINKKTRKIKIVRISREEAEKLARNMGMQILSVG
jgi:predicted metal-dependent peptidase